MKVYRVRGKYYADKEKANEQFEKLVKSQIDFEPVKEVLGDLTVIHKPDGEKFATYYDFDDSKLFNRIDSDDTIDTIDNDVFLSSIEIVGDNIVNNVLYAVDTGEDRTLFTSKADAVDYLNKMWNDTINSDKWKSVFTENGGIKEGYLIQREAYRFLICTNPFKDEDYESLSAVIEEVRIEN